MEIKVIRETFSEFSTIGRMLIDGRFYGWTLEDVDRRLEEGNEKIYGKTAIPIGRYKVIVNKSNRFGKYLPLLLDVPQFSGIRIHSGNCCEDTEGCILVGLTKGTDYVGKSRLAFDDVFEKIQEAISKNEDVFIEIVRLSGENKHDYC